MKIFRGMIVSVTFFVHELLSRRPKRIELERIGIPPKKYLHFYTMMDRGRELF